MSVATGTFRSEALTTLNGAVVQRQDVHGIVKLPAFIAEVAQSTVGKRMMCNGELLFDTNTDVTGVSYGLYQELPTVRVTAFRGTEAGEGRVRLRACGLPADVDKRRDDPGRRVCADHDTQCRRADVFGQRHTGRCHGGWRVCWGVTQDPARRRHRQWTLFSKRRPQILSVL